MRKIAFALHGTSAFMQAFVVVVYLRINTHKNQLFDVKKNLNNIGRLHFHTYIMAFYFLTFRPKKELLQQRNTHMQSNKLKSKFSVLG